MVNARCDFCDNSYKINPSAGYFKVTQALKNSLCLKEGADLNTICGEHFSPRDISESGRLLKDARPVFFHRKSVMSLDHSYYSENTNEEADEGNNKDLIIRRTELTYLQ